MILDRRMIRDEPMAEPRAEPFVEIEPRAHRSAPFRALPLDAVHVDQDLLGPPAQQRHEDRGVVAEHEAHAVLAARVLRRMPVELDRAGRACSRHLHVHALDAAPRIGGEALRHRRDVVLAINRDAPAALDQEQRQLLGEALEAAMRGRHAARSKDQHTRCVMRDLKRHSLRPAAGRSACTRLRVASRVPARVNYRCSASPLTTARHLHCSLRLRGPSTAVQMGGPSGIEKRRPCGSFAFIKAMSCTARIDASSIPSPRCARRGRTPTSRSCCRATAPSWRRCARSQRASSSSRCSSCAAADCAKLLATAPLRLPLALWRAMRRMRGADLVYVNTVVVLDYLIAARFFAAKTLVHVHEIPDGAKLKVFRAPARLDARGKIFNSKATRAAYALPAARRSMSSTTASRRRKYARRATMTARARCGC